MAYSEHILVQGTSTIDALSKLRELQRQHREGLPVTVGKPALPEPEPKTRRGRGPGKNKSGERTYVRAIRLSRAERLAIATAKGNCDAIAAQFGVEPTHVRSCRSEHKKTGGLMRVGTFDIGPPGAANYSVEFRREVAMADGTANSLAVRFRLNEMTVRRIRAEYEAGKLDL